jgi:hypothetical protein
MNSELEITAKKAHEASEDLKAFYRSLLAMAERLNSAWRFQISSESARKDLPFSLDALRDTFAHELEVAQGNFLQREKRAGKEWGSIDQYGHLGP